MKHVSLAEHSVAVGVQCPHPLYVHVLCLGSGYKAIPPDLDKRHKPKHHHLLCKAETSLSLPVTCDVGPQSP